jgi:hypothetical protein
VSPDFLRQGGKTSINILHSTLASPVALSRKIYDVLWIHLAGLEDKHTTWLDLISLTGGSIRFEVLGEGFLELKSEAASHDTDAVDGVDQRFGIFRDNVARLVFDHDGPPFRQ